MRTLVRKLIKRGSSRSTNRKLKRRVVTCHKNVYLSLMNLQLLTIIEKQNLNDDLLSHPIQACTIQDFYQAWLSLFKSGKGQSTSRGQYKLYCFTCLSLLPRPSRGCPRTRRQTPWRPRRDGKESWRPPHHELSMHHGQPRLHCLHGPLLLHYQIPLGDNNYC